MSELIKNKPQDTKKFYAVIAIGILMMLVIGNLPTFGDVTRIGMRLLGIFAGCIFMWLFGYLGIGGFIGILAIALYVPGNVGNAVFPSVFGNFNLVMVFFCLVFVYGLQQSGVLNYVAALILSTKFATKSPWHLAVAFWITGIVTGAIITNSLAATLLLFGILYSTADRIGMERRSNYTAFVIIVTATFTTLACALLPYSPTLLVPIGIMQATAPELAGTALPMAQILLCNWVLVLVALVVAAVLLKVLLASGYLKVSFELCADEKIVNDEDLKLTKRVKWGFFYVVAIILIIVGTSVVPTTTALGALLTKLGLIGSFLIVIAMMCFTTVDGERMINIEDAVKNGVPWGLYFMLAAALTLAGSISKADAGVMSTVSSFATTHLSSSSNFVFVFGVLVFTLILTNCINNVVAQQLVVPLITIVMISQGLNPVLIIGMVAIVVDHGNVMPSGSPIGAYMHGNSEWMSSKQVYLYATLGSICAIVGLLVAVPLAMML